MKILEQFLDSTNFEKPNLPVLIYASEGPAYCRLCADGESKIRNVTQIDRRFCRIEERLESLGARIEQKQADFIYFGLPASFNLPSSNPKDLPTKVSGVGFRMRRASSRAVLAAGICPSARAASTKGTTKP
jgi:hypothetical protein